MGKQKAKATLPEKELRTSTVYTMLLNGSTRLNILQYAASEWGIETRQADTYIAEAHAIIAQEAEYIRPREIGRAAARMHQVFGQAVADHDWSGAIAAQREISKLFSLYAPEAPRVLAVAGIDEGMLKRLAETARSKGFNPSEIFAQLLAQLGAADEDTESEELDFDDTD